MNWIPERLPPQHCEHYECRCERAEELARIADRTGQGRYLLDAVHVHEQKVLCRMSPPGPHT